ncbi:MULTISPECIES: hypothetical protein [unclassified Sphingomonas]|uniref:hypothetical protein n=1 Tax=unclassified Sphingomonas TaxID=196159 RepID=UPI000BC908F9|nr:MAG: hypothetical protein B7Z43_09705 [Sphingomonas sp. 12-62-6]OYX38374.1 MAG: hypothetical protein B7Y98_09180 [Sphingomonas sp. 32-62-10]OYY63511.1 MAG: hypothetical protein B7Y49_12765 [Sphingomonas sp. 28-62-11]
MFRAIAVVPATALILATGLLLGTPSSGARDRNAVPTATPVGKPESCIPHRRIRDTHVRNDSVIDFKMMGGKVYRATIKGGCPGLGFQERFGYSTALDRLCASDIITVLYLNPIGSGARCPIGQFQEVILTPP